MSFNSFSEKIKSLMKNGHFQQEDAPNLPNGGTSGYAPIDREQMRKSIDPMSTNRMAAVGQTEGRTSLLRRRRKAASQAEGNMSQANAGQTNPTDLLHNAQPFAGNTPYQGAYVQPAGNGYNAYEQPPMNAGYSQAYDMYAQPGAQAMPNPYMQNQPMEYQNQPMQQAWQGGYMDPMNAQAGQMPYQTQFMHQTYGADNGMNQQAMDPMNAQQPNVQPQYAGFDFQPVSSQTEQRQGAAMQTQANPIPDNVVPINDHLFETKDGRRYRHIERVTQLRSMSECFRIIEFMRNLEGVIVNTEAIGSEIDIQRCLDVLSGAAFTLNCSITKITQTRPAYIIEPNTVLVMPDRNASRWNNHYETQQGAGEFDWAGQNEMVYGRQNV